MELKSMVTVYITNYNYGLYIEKAIESVLNQSYTNYELIIIDDGSTDNSMEIIEKYRENTKIQIIYQKNRGLNITNNIAMRLAKGEFIVRLDADDYLDSEYLEIMVEKITSDAEIGLVFPDFYYVNNIGTIIGEEKRFNFEEEVSLYDLPAHGACTMIRLAFLKILGGYNESFSCQDGYDLWLKFINVHKVVNVNKPLFSYRRHGNNLTNNEERILDTRKAIKKTYLENIIMELPKIMAVVPVRTSIIQGSNWPLYEHNKISIIKKKIEELIRNKYIEFVVITTSEDDLIEITSKIFSEYKNVIIVKRPSEFSQMNESLVSTHEFLIKELADKVKLIDTILTVSLDYPFVDESVIGEVVDTMLIFKTDSVISVRPNNLTHYTHNGDSLEVILNQDKFTKLEREALYTGAGGLILTKKEVFLKNNQLITGRIGHVVVSSKAALCINSVFNFNLYKLLVRDSDMLSGGISGHI